MTDEIQNNGFDDLLAEAFGMPQQETEEGKRIDYLIHSTFKQNESGQELLKLWKNALIMQSTAQPGMDNIDIGINEGVKTFIRNILLTIERVENE